MALSVLPMSSVLPMISTKLLKLPPSPLSLNSNHASCSISFGGVVASETRCKAIAVDSPREVEDLPDIDWDNLSYAITPTDYIYLTKCARGENFSGGLRCYGNGTIDMSVSSGILNNGQGLLEGLKAYRKQDGGILLFRPEENALRMKMGAARLLMECPSVEQFVNAVKEVVLANQRWVPPFKKGALYIRPLLFGSGSILPPAPSPECTFLIFVSPVGNYFKGNLSPIHLVVSTEYHRATRGGAGGVKTIGNYSAVFMAQANAISSGFNEVLYLDSVHKKYLEEVSACNIFVVKPTKMSPWIPFMEIWWLFHVDLFDQLSKQKGVLNIQLKKETNHWLKHANHSHLNKRAKCFIIIKSMLLTKSLQPALL